MRLPCLLLIAALGFPLPAPSAAPTAEQIARSVQDRDTGRDSRAELRMKLFDRRGRPRERALTLLTMRRPEGDRSLIRFTYPNDIRGTGFLVWEHPKGDDERFLYLPSLGLGLVALYAQRMRIDDPETVRTTYEYFAPRFSFPPRVNLDGVRDTINFYAEQNPDFKNRKPEEFIDHSLMDELEKEGFFKKLGS